MNNSTLISVLLIIGVAILLAACGNQSEPDGQVGYTPVELNVSAASSLKDVLTDIQQKYRVVHPDVKLVYNFGASGALQQQIEQGAPADIFISAAAQQMDALQKKQLINNSTRKNLCTNELVLIVPANPASTIPGFADLAGAGVKNIAIGETKTVPAGQYARQLLQKLLLWDKIKSKIVYAKDVRTVLTYVETGNVDAGIVYKTDAMSDKKVAIMAFAPSAQHDPIVYPLALIAGTKQPQQAQEFLDYLMSKDTRAVFRQYGFGDQ